MTDILSQIDSALAEHAASIAEKNRLRFDPFGGGDYRGGEEMRWRPRVVKSGIEEGAEQAEAVVDSPEYWQAVIDARAAVRHHGVARTCRGCRDAIAVGWPLCDDCVLAHACGNERTNELDGRHMTCFRPAEHQPPCEEVNGSQWVPGLQWVATGVDVTVVPVDQFDELMAVCGDVESGLFDAVFVCELATGHGLPHRSGSTSWAPIDAYQPLPAAHHVDAGGYRSCMERLAPLVDAAVESDPDGRPFYCAGCLREVVPAEGCPQCSGQWEHVRQALSQLDGTRRSRVALRTGLSPERLDELGGVGNPDGEMSECLNDSIIPSRPWWRPRWWRR